MNMAAEVEVITVAADADKNVVIKATLQQMYNDGSRTFLSGAVAAECQSKGYRVLGYDVGRYFKSSDHFMPFKIGGGLYRWRLVGDIHDI